MNRMIWMAGVLAAAVVSNAVAVRKAERRSGMGSALEEAHVCEAYRAPPPPPREMERPAAVAAAPDSGDETVPPRGGRGGARGRSGVRVSMGSALEGPAVSASMRALPVRRPAPDDDKPAPPRGGRGGAWGKSTARGSIGSALEAYRAPPPPPREMEGPAAAAAAPHGYRRGEQWGMLGGIIEKLSRRIHRVRRVVLETLNQAAGGRAEERHTIATYEIGDAVREYWPGKADAIFRQLSVAMINVNSEEEVAQAVRDTLREVGILSDTPAGNSHRGSGNNDDSCGLQPHLPAEPAPASTAPTATVPVTRKLTPIEQVEEDLMVKDILIERDQQELKARTTGGERKEEEAETIRITKSLETRYRERSKLVEKLVEMRAPVAIEPLSQALSTGGEPSGDAGEGELIPPAPLPPPREMARPAAAQPPPEVEEEGGSPMAKRPTNRAGRSVVRGTIGNAHEAYGAPPPPPREMARPAAAPPPSAETRNAREAFTKGVQAMSNSVNIIQWLWSAIKQIAHDDWGGRKIRSALAITDAIRQVWQDKADEILEQLALTIGNVRSEAGALAVMQSALEGAGIPSGDAAPPPLRESAEEDRG
jgi:hypothetical protein